MIERGFIEQKTKEFYIKSYIESKLRGAEVSNITLKKIPLGEKIIVTTSRPSLVVGSKGSNIKSLTRYLKTHFKLENPRVEIMEVKNPYLDASVVASRIASSLERFGSSRFKGVGHKNMANVLGAGAIGVEIKISGKIPGSRAKSWRFYQGYLKKCGDISITGVRTAYTSALLKTGVIGIQVRIMPPDVILPDSIEVLDEAVQIIESEDVEKSTRKTKKKTTKKKSVSKKKTTKRKEVESKEVKFVEVVKVEEKSEIQSEESPEVEKTEETKVEEIEAVKSSEDTFAVPGATSSEKERSEDKTE